MWPDTIEKYKEHLARSIGLGDYADKMSKAPKLKGDGASANSTAGKSKKDKAKKASVEEEMGNVTIADALPEEGGDAAPAEDWFGDEDEEATGEEPAEEPAFDTVRYSSGSSGSGRDGNSSDSSSVISIGSGSCDSSIPVQWLHVLVS